MPEERTDFLRLFYLSCSLIFCGVKSLKSCSLLLFILLKSGLMAQNISSSLPTASASQLKYYVYALAHDSMKGRECASDQERSAARFIANVFKTNGLKPFFGDTSWFQEFPVRQRAFLEKGNSLFINNKRFFQNIDFYPVLFSSPANIEGRVEFTDIHSPPDSGIWMFRLQFPPSFKDSSAYAKSSFIARLTKTSGEKKLKGIILLGDTDSLNYFPLNSFQSEVFADIPIVFLQSSKLQRVDLNSGLVAAIRLRFYRTQYVKAVNVAGFMDNHAPYTVVVAAHFDHVGMGYFGSLSGEIDIHNGADDNASGTAALLELSGMLKQADFRNYNYLFIAFSAEESGLNGSFYFLNSDQGKRLKYNCMINLDMIGRISRNKAEIMMVASGSSRSWEKIAKDLNSKNPAIIPVRYVFAFSDHAWFLRQKIPAVQFFSGLHDDYHTPRDLPNRLNYEGLHNAVNLLGNFLFKIEKSEVMRFRRNKFWDKFKGSRYYMDHRNQ